jgi:Mitochondrial carrier protein
MLHGSNASALAGAGIMAEVVMYPFDTVRRRLEVSGSPLASMSYSSVWCCAVTITQKEGVASLYRGCLINCLKIGPSAALQVRFCSSACVAPVLFSVSPAEVIGKRLTYV